MQSINDQLIEIYVFVDDYLKTHPRRAARRQSNNAEPAFTDAEVMTIALMQGYFQCPTRTRTYELVRANAAGAFPQLCGYKQWLARLHQLTALLGQLLAAARRSFWQPLSLYLLDSKPIPLCKPLRHGRVRLLREDGAYFSKGSIGWYFGFKLHAIVNLAVVGR
ncbi:MAG TPA: transposase [Blastocatellia bacterium]|nr:transposase [Blastocatellia bacterium]